MTEPVRAQVYSLTLYCSGQGHGRGTAHDDCTNCLRACGGGGACMPGCAKQRERGHCCAVRLILSATLESVLRHKIVVSFTGAHRAAQTAHSRMTGGFQGQLHQAQGTCASQGRLDGSKRHFPLRIGRLARRRAAIHASRAPPPARPSLPHHFAPRSGLRSSTCPCYRRCFDAIQGLRRQLRDRHVPPCAARTSAMSIAGVSASANS